MDHSWTNRTQFLKVHTKITPKKRVETSSQENLDFSWTTLLRTEFALLSLGKSIWLSTEAWQQRIDPLWSDVLWKNAFQLSTKKLGMRINLVRCCYFLEFQPAKYSWFWSNNCCLYMIHFASMFIPVKCICFSSWSLYPLQRNSDSARVTSTLVISTFCGRTVQTFN